FTVAALKLRTESRLFTRRLGTPGVDGVAAFLSSGLICRGVIVRFGLVGFVRDQLLLGPAVRQPVTTTLVRSGRGLGPSLPTSRVVEAEASVSSDDPA